MLLRLKILELELIPPIPVMDTMTEQRMLQPELLVLVEVEKLKLNIVLLLWELTLARTIH